MFAQAMPSQANEAAIHWAIHHEDLESLREVLESVGEVQDRDRLRRPRLVRLARLAFLGVRVFVFFLLLLVFGLVLFFLSGFVTAASAAEASAAAASAAEASASCGGVGVADLGAGDVGASQDICGL